MMWQPRGRPRMNRDSQQSKGLVLWYPLCSAESAATHYLDCSGKGNHLLTSWTASQNWITHMPDYGLGMYTHTSGVTRTIQDGGVLDALTGPITIAFWYRRTATSAAGTYILGCGSTSSSTGFILAASIQNSNNLGYFPGTTGLGTLNSNNYFDMGVRAVNVTEHHCITGQGATLTHYVNGKPVSLWSLSGTQAQPTNHTTARCFGSFQSGAGPMHDLILSDLRIYNRALSASEVQTLWNPATRFDLYASDEWDYVMSAGQSMMAAEADEGGVSSSGAIIRPIVRPIPRPIIRPISGVSL